LRLIAVIVLILIAVSVHATPASAANITISFDKRQVQGQMFLSMHQNMTSFPSQSFTIDSGHDSNISAAFAQALSKITSSASFSSLTLGIATSPTWLNLTINVGVAGVTERKGDISTANVTWKALNVSDDLREGNLSYNKVGSRYLRQMVVFYENASNFETNPNATIKAVTFFLNGTSVPGTLEANQVGNFTMLDFSALNVPLDQWTRTYTLANNTTSWRYAPPSALNASVRVQKLDTNYTVVASYAYSALITASGMARAQGNVLHADVGSGLQEWIMAGVVVLMIVLAFILQILFRRRRKAVRLGRR
jgi:fumarate reductase subunit C